jgi:hypothetical protein
MLKIVTRLVLYSQIFNVRLSGVTFRSLNVDSNVTGFFRGWGAR